MFECHEADTLCAPLLKTQIDTGPLEAFGDRKGSSGTEGMKIFGAASEHGFSVFVGQMIGILRKSPR